MEKIILLQDKRYPESLRKIGKDAPKQLYYKGSWPARHASQGEASGDEGIFENCLAVVGSRRMTSYGRRVVEQIVTEVAAAGITIVSGFMYGVDAAAHKAALLTGGRTIAVMPCGIELIHPEYQQDLYVEILNNNGLVISEYEGNMLPVNWSYPRRNRIVAGLSKAALIIEAGEKSGSLITANWAKKFKRKVFAVPGPITSENSKGIMQLIKEGSTAVSSAKDVLDFYNLKTKPASVKASAGKEGLEGFEGKILEYLERESMDVDELARVFNISASKLGTILSLMQLKSLIEQKGGKYHPR